MTNFTEEYRYLNERTTVAFLPKVADISNPVALSEQLTDYSLNQDPELTLDIGQEQRRSKKYEIPIFLQ